MKELNNNYKVKSVKIMKYARSIQIMKGNHDYTYSRILRTYIHMYVCSVP